MAAMRRDSGTMALKFECAKETKLGVEQQGIVKVRIYSGNGSHFAFTKRGLEK